MNRYLFAALVLWPVFLSAQAPVCIGTNIPDPIAFEFEQATRYPSTRPVHYIRVKFGEFKDNFDAGWWKNPGNYFLKVNGKSVTTPTPLDFDRLELVTFIDLPMDLENSDTLELTVSIPRTTAGRTTVSCATGKSGSGAAASNKATVQNLSPSGFVLEPSWLPKQELVNGAKRDVGHLDITVDFPNLFPSSPLRWYLKGLQTLSTDGKDKKTQLETVFGVSRSISNSWYIPWHLEGKALGDQRVQNASVLASGGIRTIFPWAWSRSVFWNGIIRAPFSPQLELSGQFERRVKQTAATRKSLPDVNSGRLFAELKWNPIHLATGDAYGKDDISIEMSGKAWYLPWERNAAGVSVQRLEGLVEVSLLVPVRKFEVQGGLSPLGTPAAKQRIRLKYSRGAIETKGFDHVRELTLGFEVIK